MREPDNIRGVMEVGIDWMGFIFCQGSPRHVSTPASEIPKITARRVGVFVNETVKEMMGKVDAYELGAIQLHGDEERGICEELRDRLPASVFLIKAISVKAADDLLKCQAYEGVIDYFLFDTKCESRGGSGKQFDWSVLDGYKADTPFLLSGGIGPGDVERVRSFQHPRCVGIDLNSRFEIAPGVKDVVSLRHFVTSLKDKNNE